MLLALFTLIVGFLLLWKGADWMVEGTSKISQYFGIPDLIIGLTLLAFGTSAPELFVNIFANISNKPEIIFGNILGSNIANILLILGCTAYVSPLLIQKRSLFKDLPFSMFIVLLTLILIVSNGLPYILEKWHSIILITLFSIYIFRLIKVKTDIVEKNNTIKLNKAIFEFIIGILALPLGAKAVIYGATSLSQLLNIPESIIALFAIALGTSLPELVTSIIAAKRHKHDMVIGNIIGSNIFNILFVLGICGLIKPLQFNAMFIHDIGTILFASSLLFIVGYLRKELKKSTGLLFLLIYVIYIGSLAIR